LVGREQAVDEIAALLTEPDVRLATLTGPGGIGKTRLAAAVGGRLQHAFEAGAAFVSLAEIADPSLVWDAIAHVVGANLTGSTTPMRALAELIGDSRLLLILDNLDRLTTVAPDLDDLLAHCSGLSILATSRTTLRVRAENEYQVPPLPRPDNPTGFPIDEVQTWPTVELFATRARAVNRNFALTDANAAAVVEICRLLDGIPLAIELAAARTRLLDPTDLAARLSASLDAIGTGAVDLPERQHTLRATVQWSVGLLNEAELSHVDTLAVFSDGWTIDAAAVVANLDEDRTLELIEALAQHSLIQLDHDHNGLRARMLDTIRTYVAERLDSRPDADHVRGRHAAYYRNLVEQSDVGLRKVGNNEWLDRLQQESGNISVAVHWYLDHNTAPLPHLFRVLWSFWFLREHVGEARGWVKQVMRDVDSMNSESKAELIWTAQVAALEVGDDGAALAAARQLAPLLPGIQDPFLRAVSALAMAWMSPLVSDITGAIRYSVSSLDQFRTQDAPFWTALAAGSLGTLEGIAARYNDSQRHLTEACELAGRTNDVWVDAWARGQLATLAVQQGHPDQARRLLEEALGIGGSELSTSTIARTLTALAWLTFAEGDAEQAVRAAGAATGLQNRAGVRTWPTLRQIETELTNALRNTLGADQYQETFAAGAQLNRRQAIGLLTSALLSDHRRHGGTPAG
jgi:predicted ATPase